MDLKSASTVLAGHGARIHQANAPSAAQTKGASLSLYIGRQAASLPRYLWEQLIMGLLGWVPTIIGIGLRALFYRLILKMNGLAAIENGVRLRYASHIRLG